MRSQQADEMDTTAVIGRLVAQLGVAELIAVIADMTKEESDSLLLAGDRQKASQWMRDFRILQRAAQMLRY
jgi:hypothetical protein